MAMAMQNNRMPKFKNKGDFDIFSVLYDHEPNVENQIVDSQITEHLRNLLNRLPDEQQRVIKMRIYKDMSFKEIAEYTGVSINTALGRMRYAILNLRKMVDENQIFLAQ
mgnify:CR=1 FL=1